MQRGQHAALEHVALVRRGEDLLLGEHVALSGQRTAQDEVGGDVVIVARPHHEGKTRFPDAVFVVAQQGLGDAQVCGGRPLGHAALLPQQG